MSSASMKGGGMNTTCVFVPTQYRNNKRAFSSTRYMEGPVISPRTSRQLGVCPLFRPEPKRPALYVHVSKHLPAPGKIPILATSRTSPAGYFEPFGHLRTVNLFLSNNCQCAIPHAFTYVTYFRFFLWLASNAQPTTLP